MLLAHRTTLGSKTAEDLNYLILRFFVARLIGITPHEIQVLIEIKIIPNSSWWPNDLGSNEEQRENVDHLLTESPQFTEAPQHLLINLIPQW